MLFMTAMPGLEVIKLKYSLRLKIKHNDWLLADTKVVGDWAGIKLATPGIASVARHVTNCAFLIRACLVFICFQTYNLYREEKIIAFKLDSCIHYFYYFKP